MNLRPIARTALLIGLCGCIENEETITIRPDGSAHVRIAVKGDPGDLLDGYALPFAAPWKPASEKLALWCPELDEAARVRLTGLLAELAAVQKAKDEGDELYLAVEAEFASVAELPRTFAPASEPYPGAYLQRTARLDVSARGPRMVYVFERTYQAREFARYDVLREPLALAEEFGKDEETWTPAQRAQIAGVLRASIVRTSLAFADDALLAIYTQGTSAFPAAQLDVVRGAITSAIETLVPQEAMLALVAAAIDDQDVPDNDERLAREFDELEERTRAALRSSFDAALAAQGLTVPTRNAARAELEASLAAYDHTSDLGDEEFKVVLHMPGIVIGGNFDERDGDALRWKFSGEDLRERTQVLRAVSVVE